ncbi:MAG: hypothetical protein US86_C0003G0020 [Candidatus Daviesbacteria bacterium GW2011_GWA2_38_24]|uniref:Transposase IS200-like domain-containing protein n=1 Tax=Candidatus Daviesbacteria bacterium GW2011_GWA2_38_24 TaxID=1618422 RepID=A0A0G0JJ10_9BACT|nr:MAG: hypothetical protein US86_C0003G0020 [Candidatus Daviesbacteria bacterium GW2011_GWA2_38_24]KKQ77799.1 MAG: hypothetical protein UT01_C0082G0003 [Candidatus Daviesbacteria bacterium GW2011_GWA1_38_7]
MPGRPVPLITGEIYHVYNRGHNKRTIFLTPRDYKRFKQTIYYYQFKGPKIRFSRFNKDILNNFLPIKNEKLVEILGFCLMPNHFHLQLKQLQDDGISIFMSQIQNSYTKYFNTKYQSIGPLLQGCFKSRIIEDENQLTHLNRYIHLNPIVSGQSKDLESYPWSSYIEYSTRAELICSTELISSFFPSIKDFTKFHTSQIDYAMTLEILKHSAIDND